MDAVKPWESWVFGCRSDLTTLPNRHLTARWKREALRVPAWAPELGVVGEKDGISRGKSWEIMVNNDGQSEPSMIMDT